MPFLTCQRVKIAVRRDGCTVHGMRRILLCCLKTLPPVAILAFGLLGCINFEPEPRADRTRFYVLSKARPMASTEGSFDLSVRRVELPGYLDRSPMAIRVGENEIAYRVFHRWSGDLHAMIAQSLAEGLDAARPSGGVTTGIAGGIARYLDLRVLRFEGTSEGEAFVSLQWRLFRSGEESPVANGQVLTQGTWDGEDIGDLVATLSRLLGEAATELAGALPAQ